MNIGKYLYIIVSKKEKTLKKIIFNLKGSLICARGGVKKPNGITSCSIFFIFKYFID